MTRDMQDLLIIGAGLTGLNLAHQIKESGKGLNVVIAEKSRSCGGRMATRRVGESRFDHGAQFIKIKDISKKLLIFWEKEKILKKFPTDAFDAFCGELGINQLAKKLGENLNILYNTKVKNIEICSRYCLVFMENGPSLIAKKIVLTCPLPQSLEILRHSEVPFDHSLSQIKYKKAIVLLVRFDSSIRLKKNCLKNFDRDVFGIFSQQEKGLSKFFDYTVIMEEIWSEENFIKSDEEILHISKSLLIEKFSCQNILNLEVKKWKYSEPAQIWSKFFDNPAPRLYLAGDAFGGPSLNGALKSSNCLAEYLIR